jgi:hypothetical protein
MTPHSGSRTRNSEEKRHKKTADSVELSAVFTLRHVLRKSAPGNPVSLAVSAAAVGSTTSAMEAASTSTAVKSSATAAVEATAATTVETAAGSAAETASTVKAVTAAESAAVVNASAEAGTNSTAAEAAIKTPAEATIVEASAKTAIEAPSKTAVVEIAEAAKATIETTESESAEPGTGADEYAICKPVGAVVAIRRAGIRSVVVVSVSADRWGVEIRPARPIANADGYLRL